MAGLEAERGIGPLGLNGAERVERVEVVERPSLGSRDGELAVPVVG